MTMNIVHLIEQKRDGGTLTDEQIRWFIERFTAGRVPDHQASALQPIATMHRHRPGILVADLEELVDGLFGEGETGVIIIGILLIAFGMVMISNISPPDRDVVVGDPRGTERGLVVGVVGVEADDARDSSGLQNVDVVRQRRDDVTMLSA